MRRGGRPRLPRPSAAAVHALGHYARGRIVEKALGHVLALDVPADLFSAQAVDEGTLLLLDHLPPGAPRSFLDLGCGYGALGLPIAARFPGARALLVDRDLLAVAAAGHNARALGLANAEVLPGLGYRDLEPGARFDQVLCNVPARIGPRAIRYILEGGRRLGDVRIVVIRDLAPVVERLEIDGVRRIASGPRHVVFSASSASSAVDLKDESIYLRDETRFQGLALQRPHDVSEDPGHLEALSVLAESLPRAVPASVLFFRAGYGALPLHAAGRWPSSAVVAQERDLLDAAYLRRNAKAHGLSVDVRERLFFRDGLEPGSFPLVVGELSPSAGEAVAAREMQDALDLLSPGGEALLLASAKMEREWLPSAAQRSAPPTVLVRRGGTSILRISRPKVPS